MFALDRIGVPVEISGGVASACSGESLPPT
jgi:hypothetical protein